MKSDYLIMSLDKSMLGREIRDQRLDRHAGYGLVMVLKRTFFVVAMVDRLLSVRRRTACKAAGSHSLLP